MSIFEDLSSRRLLVVGWLILVACFFLLLLPFFTPTASSRFVLPTTIEPIPSTPFSPTTPIAGQSAQLRQVK